jgi:hypothetical protein
MIDEDDFWSSWWNENWQGKPKYSEKTYPSATLSTTKSHMTTRSRTPDRSGWKPATNRLSYGAALCQTLVTLCQREGNSGETYEMRTSTNMCRKEMVLQKQRFAFCAVRACLVPVCLALRLMAAVCFLSCCLLTSKSNNTSSFRGHPK